MRYLKTNLIGKGQLEADSLEVLQTQFLDFNIEDVVPTYGEKTVKLKKSCEAKKARQSKKNRAKLGDKNG